jgi:glycosyltransferase involved in cell wall biosynthesis
MKPAVLFADCRCLQDTKTRFGSTGLHAAALLRTRLRGPLSNVRAVALIDPNLGSLPLDIAQQFDQVTYILNPSFSSRREAIFLDLSPLSHEPGFSARLSVHPMLFKASVVHDFVANDWPGSPRMARDRVAFLSKLASLRTASRFFPVSWYTAGRLTELLGVSSSDIVVTGTAVRPSFLGALPTTGLPTPPAAPFFLLISGPEQWKNPKLAIDALQELNSRCESAYELVIVGDFDEAARQKLAGSIQNARVLQFRSHLSDPELIALYRQAIAVILPAYLEGFPFPILEAALCGCPVLASSCAAHAELIQDTEALFPAISVNAVANLLHRVIKVEGWRESLIRKQSRLSAAFSEQVAGQRFWEGIADGMEASRSTFYVTHGLRPRLAILSPCTPDASSAARFTQLTLESLSSLAEVDLYTDALRPLSVPRGVRDAGRITPVAYHSNRYDAVISVLGDSYLHVPILDLFERYGGPVILHDSQLIHLYFSKLGLIGLTEIASRFLGRSVTEAEAASWLDNENPETRFIESILERANPLFVHSQRFRDQIKERFGYAAQTLVFPPAHVFRAEELTRPARRSARQRLGIPEEDLVIAHFGPVRKGKAPETCISAVGELRRGQGNVHMYLAGSMRLWPEGQTWIREQNYVAFVHFFENYLADDVYRDFLLAADCAVHVRASDDGQPSSGLIDCISAGMPSVANESLAASSDTPSYVTRIADRLSPHDLAEALAVCLANSDRAAFEEQRQAFLQKHSFSNYSSRITELLEMSET